MITHNGLTSKVTMNQAAFGLGPRTTNKKSLIRYIDLSRSTNRDRISDEHAADLIDLSSPETHRTDVSQSELGRIVRLFFQSHHWMNP